MTGPSRADLLRAQLPHCLTETDFSALGLGERYRGKVRDTYRQGDRLVLITTDRLSAFDRALTTIPFKGELLNRLSVFWFEKTRSIFPNHVLDVLDPGVLVARACLPFAVEMVVRGYLTGSLWREYESGERNVYGLRLPDGMRRDQPFEKPWVTPSNKAPLGEHDAPISPAEVVAGGLMSQREWDRVQEAALAIFAEGQRWARSRGLILVDTKYEFGKIGDTLYLIDEVHTPDSSRYWIAEGSEDRLARGESQRMLDKENIRQWLITERGFKGDGPAPEIPDEVRIDLAQKYLAAFEQITGEAMPLEVGNAQTRTLRSLKAAGLIR